MTGGRGGDFGWRVLAIDDDPLFLEVVQVCLERAGCRVETTVDPQDGLNRAIEGTFDLVLLDLMMPGMAGEEILSLLKPLSLRQRVVVVSGRDEEEAREQARDLGAAGYIQKPVDTRQFTGLLYDLLRERIQTTDESDEERRPQSLLERLVTFVFGECEPTTPRKLGAVGVLLGLLVVGSLLAGG